MARTTSNPTRDAGDGTQAFTAEERAAMKERAHEVKKATRGGSKPSPEQEVLDKIAEMAEADRLLAERIHALVREHAPGLQPRTWYGMPAYGKDGKATVFFQAAAKFKARYATLGFNDDAEIDEGTMWPTAFALTTLTAEDEARVVDLIRRAAG